MFKVTGSRAAAHAAFSSDPKADRRRSLTASRTACQRRRKGSSRACNGASNTVRHPVAATGVEAGRPRTAATMLSLLTR